MVTYKLQKYHKVKAPPAGAGGEPGWLRWTGLMQVVPLVQPGAGATLTWPGNASWRHIKECELPPFFLFFFFRLRQPVPVNLCLSVDWMKKGTILGGNKSVTPWSAVCKVLLPEWQCAKSRKPTGLPLPPSCISKLLTLPVVFRGLNCNSRKCIMRNSDQGRIRGVGEVRGVMTLLCKFEQDCRLLIKPYKKWPF